MLIPILIPHGERIHTDYAPASGSSTGLVGRSIDEERQLGGGDGIVTRYKKDQSAASSASALGYLKSLYGDAIEYTSLTKNLKGTAFYWAIFLGLGMAPAFVGCGIFLMSIGDFKDIFFLVSGSLVTLGSLAFGLYVFSTLIRIELFQPEDLPIIFDRRNKKIFRLMREEQSGFLGAFKAWPIMACEYDWNLVDCEHQAQIFPIGGVISTNHFLMFLVRKSPADPTIIDSFQLANSASLSDDLCDRMWEHVRRFMEENGPHLPTPHEPLADMTAPPSWWESLGAVGPFGSNYWKFWRDSPLYTIFMHLIFPISLPMFFLWGTGNYLSFKTAIAVHWPAEVLTAIGPKQQPRSSSPL